MSSHNCTSSETAQALRATWVGFWCNAVLGAVKVVAGIVGHSGAVVADGIHSFSDFITDIIVLVMVPIGRRGSNNRYKYGHGKYETFATLLVAWALVAAGLFILYEGTSGLLDALHGHTLPRPEPIALAVCALSIAVKEWLYHYTVRVGRRIGSQAVIANAWHHRSDSFSSIATLIGVAGAMFLGDEWRILDPIAEMIVAVFIVIVGCKTSGPAISELLEASLPVEVQHQIENCIQSTPGVVTYHRLRTRRNGQLSIVDVHIKVNPEITVTQGHEIATEVEHRIAEALGSPASITTHIEPANPIQGKQ